MSTPTPTRAHTTDRARNLVHDTRDLRTQAPKRRCWAEVNHTHVPNTANPHAGAQTKRSFWGQGATMRRPADALTPQTPEP